MIKISKPAVRKWISQICSFTLGTALIAANGIFMLTKEEPVITHAEPVVSEGFSDESSQEKKLDTYGSAEKSSVRTISAADLPDGSDYEKAQLSDYRILLSVQTVQEDDAETSETDGDFSVELQLDSTTVYDIMPDPMNFTETRSIANEYYTVYDIISGSTVTLSGHELLCRMVYSEIGSTWDENAIKAQAVASYSYLRFNDSLGLTPTVGLKSGYPAKIDNCISAVEGQAVYYNGDIINAVYSASTAGYTVESEQVWNVYYPYLRAVVSEYDYEDPNYGLEYEYTKEEVRSLIEDAYGIVLSDDVSNWISLENVHSGRYVGTVSIDGQTTDTGTSFKSALGLKSRAFTVEYSDGTFKFTSYGWGHGVGMSQWGACYYAAHGYTYDQILRHYYIDTSIALSDENTRAVARGQESSDGSSGDSEVSSSSDADQTPSGENDSSSYDSGSSDSDDYTYAAGDDSDGSSGTNDTQSDNE